MPTAMHRIIVLALTFSTSLVSAQSSAERNTDWDAEASRTALAEGDANRVRLTLPTPSLRSPVGPGLGLVGAAALTTLWFAQPFEDEMDDEGDDILAIDIAISLTIAAVTAMLTGMLIRRLIQRRRARRAQKLSPILR